MVNYLLMMIRKHKGLYDFVFRVKDYTNDLLVSSNLKSKWRFLTKDQDFALREVIHAERSVNGVQDADIDFEMYSRLNAFRTTVIPWLRSRVSLDKLRVLEVGCGSGAGTCALAEQGCRITGIDIDTSSVIIGERRLKAYGLLNADIRHANAADLSEMFHGVNFDLILFFATLEHMTLTERLASLKSAWDILPIGGYLCVIETPNRLWLYDDHTSALPFFDWLPDSLAILYADRSPKLRGVFGGQPVHDDTLMRLVRFGRGVSFHEFELAGIDCAHVDSNMVEFLRRNPLYAAKYYFSWESGYSRLLRKWAPKVHRAFSYHRLDLLIRKSR
jgi:2-polyprenyl-3-methyl-5-hydroxy-6-metoxy-1,4-benzoquinol methylase